MKMPHCWKSMSRLICKMDHVAMGESSKFPKSETLEIQILKLAGCLQKLIYSCLND